MPLPLKDVDQYDIAGMLEERRYAVNNWQALSKFNITPAYSGTKKQWLKS